ncbi:hypothetical protein FCV25MIE_23048 [Fagus crenata]
MTSPGDGDLSFVMTSPGDGDRSFVMTSPGDGDRSSLKRLPESENGETADKPGSNGSSSAVTSRVGARCTVHTNGVLCNGIAERPDGTYCVETLANSTRAKLNGNVQL